MFVSDEKVAITLGEETIFTREKMSLGVRNKVIGAAASIVDKSAAVDVGKYSTALLVENVLGWEGGRFEGVKCTPAMIERLDPNEPLVEMVLDEIARRNNTSEDPKSSASAGSNGSTGTSRKAKRLESTT